MKKFSAGIATLSLCTQIAFPAFASEQQKQDFAMATLSVEHQLALGNAAARLETHLGKMTDERRLGFYTKLSKLVEKADLKLAKMSDKKLERRMKRFAETTESQLSEQDPTEAPDSTETQLLTDISAETNEAANLPTPAQPADTAAVNQLTTALQGMSPRQKTQFLVQSLRSQLSQKTSVDKPARAIASQYNLLQLILAVTLLILLVYGLLVLTAILLPLLITASCVLGIVLIIRL
jgi:hypothetical protein